MSKAVPLKQILQQPQPSAVDQYRAVSGALAKGKPALDTARATSEDLARQTADLQKKLIDSAAKVEFLESETVRLDAEVKRLTADYARLSADFAKDRVSVTKLLALMERRQHDLPPAMAVRPDDALAAARGAMLLGAWLGPRYDEAAQLSRRIAALQQTRTDLMHRRAEAAATAQSLTSARGDLDRLLTIKRQEADVAATRYGVLKTNLDTLASQAVGLQALLKKVAALRAQPSQQADFTANAGSARPSLLAPVVGTYHSGGVDGVGGASAPGLTYVTLAGATVISPADGKIIFAGSFPKVGHVLILEIGAGYDAVLAGLDRLDVRSNDAVLAGEPVGAMPKFDHEPRLYFELRQKNGHGTSPAPFIAVALRKAR
jgi:septal ring factor EnvC (AmiA/AmiB activator)